MKPAPVAACLAGGVCLVVVIKQGVAVARELVRDGQLGWVVDSVIHGIELSALVRLECGP